MDERTILNGNNCVATKLGSYLFSWRYRDSDCKGSYNNKLLVGLSFSKIGISCIYSEQVGVIVGIKENEIQPAVHVF